MYKLRLKGRKEKRLRLKQNYCLQLYSTLKP